MLAQGGREAVFFCNCSACQARQGVSNRARGEELKIDRDKGRVLAQGGRGGKEILVSMMCHAASKKETTNRTEKKGEKA